MAVTWLEIKPELSTDLYHDIKNVFMHDKLHDCAPDIIHIEITYSQSSSNAANCVCVDTMLEKFGTFYFHLHTQPGKG